MRTQASSVLDRLTPKGIMAAADGDHVDGGGLQLSKRGRCGSWVYRFVSPAGRRRAIGLGAARLDNVASAEASLFAARAAAADSRNMLLCGIDPYENREGLRLAVKEARAGQMAQKLITLEQASHDFHKRVIEPTHDEGYARSWLATLVNHVPPNIWRKRLNDISAPELLRALNGMRATRSAIYLPAGPNIPMTVRRVRANLDRVFDDALFYGRCTSNPAAARATKAARERDEASTRGHYAALPYPAAPALYERLLDARGTVARCLEFSILTTSRKIETTMARWSEFKLEEGLWTVPGDRMKGRKEHLVFLTDRAIEIVRNQRGIDATYVFSSILSKVGDPKHVTEGSLRALLGRLHVAKKTTLHGLCRATFSTWAYETSNFRSDVIEACLAHGEADSIKAAYNRAEFRADRKALLAAWDEFLNPTVETNVAALDRSGRGPRLVAAQSEASAPRQYLRLRDVMERVGLCQASIYTKVREKNFPKPFKIGPMNGWLESEVVGWIKARHFKGHDLRRVKTRDDVLP